MSCKTECRTQLLKPLASICQVTSELGKANLNWTQNDTSLSVLIALEREVTLHRARTYPTSLLTHTEKCLSHICTQATYTGTMLHLC